MESGNYKLTLRPLLYEEYLHPERLTAEEADALQQKEALDIPTPSKCKIIADSKGVKYTSPWRKYECVDGNHKLFVFQN